VKNYTKWLHWNVTRFCNFSCEYCFSHSPYKNGKLVEIDFSKVIENLEKTGEVFRISFTGGEPFLIKDFVYFCAEISKKHYLSFNTNLTHKTIKEFACKIDPEQVIKIDASFHYSQLKEKKLLSTYLENFRLLKNAFFKINCEQVAYPGLINNINEIKQISTTHNLSLRFVPFFGVYNNNRYPVSYSEKEMEIFNLNLSQIEKFNQKGRFCNAGYNVGVVFSNGNIKPCFQIKDNISNIYEQIKFRTKPVFSCKSRICGCPLNIYDSDLLTKAKDKLTVSGDIKNTGD